MKAAAEAELKRLVKLGITERVDTTVQPIEWASPIVCVKKLNRTYIRKVTHWPDIILHHC